MSELGVRLVTDGQRELWGEKNPVEVERRKTERLGRKLHPVVDRVKAVAAQHGGPEDLDERKSVLVTPWKRISADPESGAPIYGRLRGYKSDAPALRKTGIASTDLETKLGNIDYSPGDEEQAIVTVAKFWGNQDTGTAQLLGEDGAMLVVGPENQKERLPVVEALVEQIEAAFGR